MLNCQDIDEGLRIANDTQQEPAASWSDDIGEAHRTAAAPRARTVWIKPHNNSAPLTSFGGFKQIGIGRDRCRHDFDT